MPGLVVAHRGAWDPAPQNSIAAFEQAIVDGADAVELDVRRTADRRLVVVHDPRVGMRPVSRLALHELRERLPAGGAPALEEVLAVLAGRILVDIELKEDGYVSEVMTAVARTLPARGYVVTSFLDAILPQVRRLAPDASTGLLLAAHRPTRQLDRRVDATGVRFVAPRAALVRTGVLHWANARGLPAWVWTVNERRAQRTLLADPRVGAVITDRARAAVQVAQQLTGTARAA